MPLVTITPELITTGQVSLELSALSDNGAAVSGIITSVCDGIARDVNASGRNDYLPSGADQVPAGLVHVAVVLIRHAILADFPDLSELLGQVRSDEYRAALDVLSDIRRGTIKLEPFSDTENLGVVVVSGRYLDWSKL